MLATMRAAFDEDATVTYTQVDTTTFLDDGAAADEGRTSLGWGVSTPRPTPHPEAEAGASTAAEDRPGARRARDENPSGPARDPGRLLPGAPQAPAPIVD